MVPCRANSRTCSPGGIGVLPPPSRVRITDWATSGMVSSRSMAAATAVKLDTPGHDLGVQAEFGALLELLLDGAPERGVAGVDPGDGEFLSRRALVVGQHALHRKLRGVDDLRVLAGVGQDALVDQARRPDDDVGCGDGARAALGEQIRRAGARSHEHHASLRLAAVTGWSGRLVFGGC